MTFQEWTNRYWGLPTPVVQQAAETGLSPEQIVEWASWTQRKAYEHLLAEKSLITKEEVLVLWQKEHPPMVQRLTPFGTVNVPVGVRLVCELTVDEFEAILAKHCGK